MKPATAKQLRAALNLPATYTVTAAIDAPFMDPELGRGTARYLFRLQTTTHGQVTAFAAQTFETGIVEIGETMFHELVTKAFKFPGL